MEYFNINNNNIIKLTHECLVNFAAIFVSMVFVNYIETFLKYGP